MAIAQRLERVTDFHGSTQGTRSCGRTHGETMSALLCPIQRAPIKRHGAILGRINASPRQGAKDFLPPAPAEAAAIRGRAGLERGLRRGKEAVKRDAGAPDAPAKGRGKRGAGNGVQRHSGLSRSDQRDATDRLRLAVAMAQDSRRAADRRRREFANAALGGAWGDRALHRPGEFEAAVREPKSSANSSALTPARARQRIRPLRRSDHRPAAGGRSARADARRDARRGADRSRARRC